MPPAFTLLNIWLLVVAVNVGRFLRGNPMLLGRSSGWAPPAPGEFHAYAHHHALDHVLDRHREALGSDYGPYRNHCLRVLSFAAFYLERGRGGSKKESGPKATAAEVNLMALALAYHDIALWTDGKLDYLGPSVAAFESDLQLDLSLRDGGSLRSDGDVGDAGILPAALDEAEAETVRQIILQHHRYTDWKRGESIADAALVNAVRKADWADFTMGAMRSDLPVNYLEAAYEAAPPLGFHRVLAGMGSRLSPNSFMGRLDVLKIFKW
jgi:hypothetical protein